MNYYLRRSFDARIEGPLSLDDINERLSDGTLDLLTLATPDLGESLKRVQGLPRHDWTPLQHTPKVKGYTPLMAESKNAIRLRSFGQAFLFVTAIFLVALALTYLGCLILLSGF